MTATVDLSKAKMAVVRFSEELVGTRDEVESGRRTVDSPGVRRQEIGLRGTERTDWQEHESSERRLEWLECDGRWKKSAFATWRDEGPL